MSYKQSDVKDGRPPCRAKPLRTQSKVSLPRSSKDEQTLLIEVRFNAPSSTIKMGEAVKVVGLNDLPAPERRVQVAAARLRVTLDERLDRLTPPEVQALAKEPL